MPTRTVIPAPTDEQAAAADAFRAGEDVVIQAGAGAGKTSTLGLFSHRTARRLGCYLAPNGAAAAKATRHFRGKVKCTTAHALAYKALSYRYYHRSRPYRRSAERTGQFLGITHPVRVGFHDISPHALSEIVLRTVTGFCRSVDLAITTSHLPALPALDNPTHLAELAEIVLPFARKAWADLQDPDSGGLYLEPDHYLKLWALTRPRILADFLLLDEAQDVDPVVEQIFLGQRDHAQLAMAGDTAAALHHRPGARDVMTSFDGTHLTLTHSFRCGPAITEEANRWLDIARAPIRLTAATPIPIALEGPTTPDAVVCRTNVGALTEVLHLVQAGHHVATALVGCAPTLDSLTLAVRDLTAGRPTTHPELILFPHWDAVQDYATHHPAGRDFQPLVDLVNNHGINAIRAALSHHPSFGPRAEVFVSTVHEAKGRHWSSVRIAGDFPPPHDTNQRDENGNPLPGPIEDTEARLAYVAVTRARRHLDRGGLAWIDHHPDGQ